MNKNIFNTVAFSIISFLFLAIIFSGPLGSIKTTRMLQSYESTIKQLNDYKSEHGVYPSRFGVYASDMYQTFNNKQDFKLHIGEYPTYYNYCTSKKIDGCDENVKNPEYKYKKIGKWIEEFYWGSL